MASFTCSRPLFGCEHPLAQTLNIVVRPIIQDYGRRRGIIETISDVMVVDMRTLGQILQDGMNLESQRFHGNLDSKWLPVM